MRSVAIVGEFAAGKTTLADHLVEHYGYTRVSFAFRLKECCARVYSGGRPIEKNESYTVTKGGMPTQLSGRELLQQFGQSVKSMDEQFWIRWLLRDIDSGAYGNGPFVTDDCRFPYEAAALRARNFAVVRLRTPEPVRINRYVHLYGRSPTEAEMSHPSEVEAQKIEADLVLDGMIPVEQLSLAVAEYGDLLAA